MTAQEAYKWLYIHFAPCGDETMQDEAVNVALKALKKQIPKKPIINYYVKQNGDIGKKCACGGFVSNVSFYCQNCGQRLNTRGTMKNEYIVKRHKNAEELS